MLLLLHDLCFCAGQHHHHSLNSISFQMNTKLEYIEAKLQESGFILLVKCRSMDATIPLHTYNFIEILHRLSGFVCMTARKMA